MVCTDPGTAHDIFSGEMQAALAQRKLALESAPDGLCAKKVGSLRIRVKAAERAVKTLQLKSVATLVFDRVHGAEAKKEWFRSDFIYI